MIEDWPQTVNSFLERITMINHSEEDQENIALVEFLLDTTHTEKEVEEYLETMTARRLARIEEDRARTPAQRKAHALGWKGVITNPIMGP